MRVHFPLSLSNRQDVKFWILIGKKFSLQFFFKFLKFIYFERESARERAQEEQRGRERENIPSRFHDLSTEPDAELKPTNCEIMT